MGNQCQPRSFVLWSYGKKRSVYQTLYANFLPSTIMHYILSSVGTKEHFALPFSSQLIDNLISFVRERFLEEFEAGSTKPIQFMEIAFGVDVSKMHPKCKTKSYKIPKKVSKYVSRDLQWHTDVELLYRPYIIHGNWVGLCIDLPSHEITILLPDLTEYAIKEVQKELLPLASSLPFLITNCATNAEMEADISTPFTITSYAGEWEIKRKGKIRFIRCD